MFEIIEQHIYLCSTAAPRKQELCGRLSSECENSHKYDSFQTSFAQQSLGAGECPLVLGRPTSLRLSFETLFPNRLTYCSTAFTSLILL